jgi:hypothetical protein
MIAFAECLFFESPVVVITRDAILVSMYYNLWNIRKATSHYSSDCFSDQGTFKEAKWHLASKCPSSYSTLKPALRQKF